MGSEAGGSGRVGSMAAGPDDSPGVGAAGSDFVLGSASGFESIRCAGGTFGRESADGLPVAAPLPGDGPRRTAQSQRAVAGRRRISPAQEASG